MSAAKQCSNEAVGEITEALDERGYAIVPQLLSAADCSELSSQFDDDQQYRSTIDMARYRFGRGSYRYYNYPLPPVVEQLRQQWYPALASVANRWREQLGKPSNYPASLSEYLRHCHQLGQTRATPLILRYRKDDFNCLHQDLYGDEVFPLQMAVLLSRPGQDFSGGEFVLTEQRPRQQSRVEVVPIARGDAVIFAVSKRPVAGTRGSYQVNLRHGVSRLHRGERFTLGVIFHDAT